MHDTGTVIETVHARKTRIISVSLVMSQNAAWVNSSKRFWSGFQRYHYYILSSGFSFDYGAHSLWHSGINNIL